MASWCARRLRVPETSSATPPPTISRPGISWGPHTTADDGMIDTNTSPEIVSGPPTARSTPPPARCGGPPGGGGPASRAGGARPRARAAAGGRRGRVGGQRAGLARALDLAADLGDLRLRDHCDLPVAGLV